MMRAARWAESVPATPPATRCSVAGDAEFVASILESIEGPVDLVGHSYGGSVISNAALGQANVRALVYVKGPERFIRPRLDGTWRDWVR